MSNQKRTPQPRGPEGVPVDAPGNDAPAISPHAVSRMPRAENDREVIEHSLDFTDDDAVAHDDGAGAEAAGSEGDSAAGSSDADGGLESQDPKNGKPNPSHGTHKSPEAHPRGAGDGELMEQPGSQSEAREPGADGSKFDE